MKEGTITSRDFLLVAVGQLISLFGNQILRYALPLYLLIQTGSSALFGTILAFAFIPSLLLFPIGGILADRLNKRNIMVCLDFCTALLIMLFCILQGRVEIVPLMAGTLMLLYAIQGAYQPAVKASVPVLVHANSLIQANSIVDVINSTAQLAGPVLGGILFSFMGLEPILYVSIVCFLLSSFMELFIRIPHEKQAVQGNLILIGLQDIQASFRFLQKGQPVLWRMSLYYAMVNLVLTPLMLIGLPVLITQHLGFSAEMASRLYGYAQGMIAFGSILGGLLAGVLSNKLKAKTIPLFIIGGALTMLLCGIVLQTVTAPMLVYVILAVGCGLLLTQITVFTVQMMSYIQMLTPVYLIGKIISCVMCLCMCTNPLGQFCYGLIFERLGSSGYLAFDAAALVMIGISLFARQLFADVDTLLS